MLEKTFSVGLQKQQQENYWFVVQPMHQKFEMNNEFGLFLASVLCIIKLISVFNVHSMDFLVNMY